MNKTQKTPMEYRVSTSFVTKLAAVVTADSAEDATKQVESAIHAGIIPDALCCEQVVMVKSRQYDLDVIKVKPDKKRTVPDAAVEKQKHIKDVLSGFSIRELMELLDASSKDED